MTDRVEPTLDGNIQSRQLAAALRFAGGSSGGWIVPSANDPANIAGDNSDITKSNLNAFAETSSGSSFDVTIDGGQAYIGGAWLARDTTTTVTLSSSTNNQDVYVGWDVSTNNSVIIGTSSAFDADDPKHKIWTFDTDGSGVTSSTDQRNLDDFRVAISDVESHASTHGSAGSDTIDAANLGGSSGSSGQFLTTDGSVASWSDADVNQPDWSEDSNSPKTASGANSISFSFADTLDVSMIFVKAVDAASTTSNISVTSLNSTTTSGFEYKDDSDTLTTGAGSISALAAVQNGTTTHIILKGYADGSVPTIETETQTLATGKPVVGAQTNASGTVDEITFDRGESTDWTINAYGKVID